MTQDQKIIRAKVGLLELAKQLGNVSKACKMIGGSRDSFYRFKELSRYLIGRAWSRHLVNAIGWSGRASPFIFPKHTDKKRAHTCVVM
jgi:hypothetical protein